MPCQCTASNPLLDALIEQVGTSSEKAIPLLQAVQEKLRYVPPEAIEYLAAHTDMTETQLYGVATFYSQFRLKPVGEKIIKVCHGTACHVAGAEGITEALEKRLGIKDGETTPDGKYTLSSVACLGCCSLAPVVAIDNDTYGNLDRKRVVELIDKLEATADS